MSGRVWAHLRVGGLLHLHPGCSAETSCLPENAASQILLGSHGSRAATRHLVRLQVQVLRWSPPDGLGTPGLGKMSTLFCFAFFLK